MQDAIEDLQMKFAHQELEIETLSTTVFEQQKMIDRLREELDHVKHVLSELKPSPLGDQNAPEPPPPHY